MPKMGKPPKGKKHTQSVLVPKAKFTKAAARKWVKDHGHKTGGLDIGTGKFYRFRQYDPDDANFRYYNQKLPNGVILVNAVPKGTAVTKGFWGGQIMPGARIVLKSHAEAMWEADPDGES